MQIFDCGKVADKKIANFLTMEIDEIVEKAELFM